MSSIASNSIFSPSLKNINWTRENIHDTFHAPAGLRFYAFAASNTAFPLNWDFNDAFACMKNQSFEKNHSLPGPYWSICDGNPFLLISWHSKRKPRSGVTTSSDGFLVKHATWNWNANFPNFPGAVFQTFVRNMSKIGFGYRLIDVIIDLKCKFPELYLAF